MGCVNKVEHLVIGGAQFPQASAVTQWIAKNPGVADAIRLDEPVRAILNPEDPTHNFLRQQVAISQELHDPDIIDLLYPPDKYPWEMVEKARATLEELSGCPVLMHPLEINQNRRRIKRAFVSCIDFRFFKPVTGFIGQRYNHKVHYFSWPGVMLGFVGPFGEIVLNELKSSRANILHLVFHDECGGHGFATLPRPVVAQVQYYCELTTFIVQQLRDALGDIKVHISFSNARDVVHLATFERGASRPVFAL